MRVISVQQPWAQLIVDRRRHIIFKRWAAEPGDVFAIHASHVRNEEKCMEFGYCTKEDTPKNAILGVVEVKRVFPRLAARPSKFDYHSPRVEPKKLYAIVVRTITKLRQPIAMNPPAFRDAVWNCDLPELLIRVTPE